MEKDFFEKDYPQISKLYNNYINSEEYMNHPLVNIVEPYTTKAIENALDLLNKGNEVKASDALTECAVTYEQSGFILGFSLAINYVRESIVRKVAE